MTAVDVVEGIKYGFVLLGYFIVVFIAGGIILAIGGGISDVGGIGATIFGGLLALIGILVIYAGLFGIGYKIIADGVQQGIESAGGLTPGDTVPRTREQ